MTVAAGAIEGEVGGEPARFAGLRSVVGFKRLAGRPQDKRDLEELEVLYGNCRSTRFPGSTAERWQSQREAQKPAPSPAPGRGPAPSYRVEKA